MLYYFLRKKLPVDRELYNYDMIHFHWTEEMYLNRDFLSDYKGKVILTSHSPCVMYKEKIEMCIRDRKEEVPTKLRVFKDSELTGCEKNSF